MKYQLSVLPCPLAREPQGKRVDDWQNVKPAVFDLSMNGADGSRSETVVLVDRAAAQVGKTTGKRLQAKHEISKGRNHERRPGKRSGLHFGSSRFRRFAFASGKDLINATECEVWSVLDERRPSGHAPRTVPDRYGNGRQPFYRSPPTIQVVDQPREESLAVVIATEDFRPAVAAAWHMIDSVGKLNAWRARHVWILPYLTLPVIHKVHGSGLAPDPTPNQRSDA